MAYSTRARRVRCRRQAASRTIATDAPRQHSAPVPWLSYSSPDPRLQPLTAEGRRRRHRHGGGRITSPEHAGVSPAVDLASAHRTAAGIIALHAAGAPGCHLDHRALDRDACRHQHGRVRARYGLADLVAAPAITAPRVSAMHVCLLPIAMLVGVHGPSTASLPSSSRASRSPLEVEAAAAGQHGEDRDGYVPHTSSVVLTAGARATSRHRRSFDDTASLHAIGLKQGRVACVMCSCGSPRCSPRCSPSWCSWPR
jgi:hypothetical protein